MTQDLPRIGAPTVGWGVVGCGRMSRGFVAPALLGAPGARVLALHDPDRGALAAMAELLPAAAPFEGLDGLLAHPGLQVVYVVTPRRTHRAVVEQAAAARKAVLVRQPLAHDLADATALVEAVEAAGVVGGTAFEQRFHPAHAKMTDLVDDGLLGTVTDVLVVDSGQHPDPPGTPPTRGSAPVAQHVHPATSSAALLDLAPAGLDLLGSILTDDPVELSRQRPQRGFDEPAAGVAVLSGRTRKGVQVRLHVGADAAGAPRRGRLEITGTAGQLTAVDTLGHTAGGSLTFTPAEGGPPDAVPFDTSTSPGTAQVARFGRAGVGAGPWGWGLRRDLRLHRLLLAASLDDAGAAEPAWQ